MNGEFLEDSVIGDADAGADGYVAISELMDDELVKSPLCPMCKRLMKAEDKPLHSKGQRYTFHYACGKHGDMLLTLKLHRNFNETWRARRTLKLATDDALAEYREGLEKANIRRKATHRRRPKSKRRATPTEE